MRDLSQAAVTEQIAYHAEQICLLTSKKKLSIKQKQDRFEVSEAQLNCLIPHFPHEKNQNKLLSFVSESPNSGFYIIDSLHDDLKKFWNHTDVAADIEKAIESKTSWFTRGQILREEENILFSDKIDLSSKYVEEAVLSYTKTPRMSILYKKIWLMCHDGDHTLKVV
jgi:hypothetical protein